MSRRVVLAVALAVVLVAAIAAGVYFFFQTQAPETPDMGNLRIAISTPDYEFVDNENAGELLVVTGNVTNRYDGARKHIRVQGNLFDASGNVLKKSTAFAGNTLTTEELQTLPLAEIGNELTNRKGDNNLNSGVSPDEKLPFTVVFSNLPDAMDELSVEVLESAAQ